MKYDLNYFIKKFEAIPEEKWTICETKNTIGQCCALGHCGATGTGEKFWNKESRELVKVTGGRTDLPIIVNVNDGNDGYITKFGATPKQRVINYLKSIKSC